MTLLTLVDAELSDDPPGSGIKLSAVEYVKAQYFTIRPN